MHQCLKTENAAAEVHGPKRCHPASQPHPLPQVLPVHLLVLLLAHCLPVLLVVDAGVLTEVLEKVAGP
jgi:hypothetical protein